MLRYSKDYIWHTSQRSETPSWMITDKDPLTVGLPIKGIASKSSVKERASKCASLEKLKISKFCEFSET